NPRNSKVAALEKVKGSDRVTFSLCETTTPCDDNHLLPPQFTGRDILALDRSFPALYRRLHYDSRWAASTRRRLGSRAKRLTTLSLVRALVLAKFGPLIQAAA